MAKTKAAPASEATSTTLEQPKKLNKAAVVKEAFAKLGAGATSSEIKAFAQDKHGVSLSTTYIYLLKQGKGQKKETKSTKAKAEKPQAAPVAKAQVHSGNGKATTGISLADLKAIKSLTERLGASDLQALISLLA